jgi:hypothetical protein
MPPDWDWVAWAACWLAIRLAKSMMAEVSPEASALASLVFIAADTVPYRQRERRNLNWLPT